MRNLVLVTSLAVCSGCTVTQPIRDLSVNSVVLDHLEKTSVAVVISESGVRDVYQNKADNRNWVVTGVRKQIEDAFRKQLEPTFARVRFVSDPGEAGGADYVLLPTLRIISASRVWTIACIAEFSLIAKDRVGKTLMTREKKVERQFAFTAQFGSTCGRATEEAFEAVMERTLEALDSRAR